MVQVVPEWSRWYRSGPGGTGVVQVVPEWSRWYRTGGTETVLVTTSPEHDIAFRVVPKWTGTETDHPVVPKWSGTERNLPRMNLAGVNCK